MKTKKLVVFSTDPIIAYYNKGEIKERYYNPGNYFDEVHIITLIDAKKEIKAEKVKILAGKAKLYIHPVGDFSLLNPLKNPFLPPYIDRVISLVEEIKPDIIRAYDPTIRGFLAWKCAQHLKIPFIVSVHTDFDNTVRRGALKNKNWKRILFYYGISPFIERFVLSKANWVISVYGFAQEYVHKHRRNRESLILNRVPERFCKNKAKNLESTYNTIIWVGSMIKVKNHRFLIETARYFAGFIILIGTGPLEKELRNLARKLEVEKKVFFAGKVNNSELYKWYNSAKFLVSPSIAREFSIPIIEAMACGLGIVYVCFNKKPIELPSDIGIAVEPNPKILAHTLNKMFHCRKGVEKLRRKAKMHFYTISGEIMEKRELNIYKKLLKNFF